MKSRQTLCSLLVGFFSSLASFAQFRPEELARRPMWEDFLSTAKIIKSERIKEGVGPYLSNSESKAILHRKDLLLQEIDALIKAKGEGAVLY